MATTQANSANARRVPGALSVRVPITAVQRIPHPKDKFITCRFCGHTVPRWIKPLVKGEKRESGVWLLLEHQLQAHRGEAE